MLSNHSYPSSEISALIRHINNQLSDCKELQDRLPLNPNDELAFFQKIKDGQLLSFLIKQSSPQSIDLTKLNKNFEEKKKLFQMVENQNLCLQAASKIGCNIINLGPMDLIDGKPYLVMGLVWQVVKCALLNRINLVQYPELKSIGGEDLVVLPPEQLLLRWVNYNLKAFNVSDIKNFSSDIKDSTKYIYLMHQLDPSLNALDALREPDLTARANRMLLYAEQLGCTKFMTAEDICSGNEKLNLVFVASLFQRKTVLTPLTEQMERHEKENILMKKEISTLRSRLEQYDKLVSENLSLKEELTVLKLKGQALAEDFKERKTSAASSEVEKLRSKQASLENLIEHLKGERERSDEHIARLKHLCSTFTTTEALATAIYGNLLMNNIQENSILQGLVSVKESSKSSWKTRYLILKDHFLFAYKNEKEKNPIEVIRVDDAQLKLTNNDSLGDIKFPFVLSVELITVQRLVCWYLAADKPLLDEWNEALKSASNWWARSGGKKVMAPRRGSVISSPSNSRMSLSSGSFKPI